MSLCGLMTYCNGQYFCTWVSTESLTNQYKNVQVRHVPLNGSTIDFNVMHDRVFKMITIDPTMQQASCAQSFPA
jgi:hypothetical protein